ncbi:mitochondrial carrier [Xylariaceae sp. FL0662B]|nr:mitochondrial carrier [Xylariaceae sp. FL0662B]
MSHDEARSHPTGRSPSDSTEYGIFSHRSSSAATSTGSSADHHSPGGQGTLGPAVAVMELHNSSGLTPLQKWAAVASEPQFNALSGAIGGFTSGIVTCPLDVIKTKLQAQGRLAPITKGRHVGQSKVYSGLFGTAKVIWREDGLRGMYRGLGPIILGYLPTWAVWFTVYNKSKRFLAQQNRKLCQEILGDVASSSYGCTISKRIANRHVTVQNQFVINFWSSIVAGASSTIVTNPIWVIKTRLMSQSSTGPTINSPWHYSSTLDAARKMYSSEGILSFYSGLTPALLGLTHVAVQFPAYEYLRTKFTGERMGEMGSHDQKNHWLGVLSASIMSKVLASSATYPHEVIRTRLQTQRRPAPGNEYLQGFDVSEHTPGNRTQTSNGARNSNPEPKYRGVLMTFRTILREEGWRAFYAGMGVNMMRAVPAATVTMMTYEFVMKTLHQAQLEGRRKKNLNTTTTRES